MIINKEYLTYKIGGFYELTNDDIYELAKARYEVFVCDQKITCENDFDDRDQDCYHMLGYYDNKVIAYCRILKPGVAYKTSSIGRVLVLKDYRRNNIAKEMMEKAVEFIINDLGYEEITLSAQLYVKDLYESIGFKVISDIYEEAEIPHIKMSLKRG